MGLAIRILIVLWTGLSTLAVSAQQKTNKSPNTVQISGTVIDDCGDEVHYASVLLLPPGSKTPQAITRADDEGTFIFTGITPSSYDLQVTAPGYKPAGTAANASQGDVSVTVRIDGPPVCPSASPRIRYLHSPLPQTLDSPQAHVYADGPEQLSIFPRTTVCEIAKSQTRFNGKIVTVRAPIEIDFEQFQLSAKECKDRVTDAIWLQYGRGPKNQPTTWCCGDLTPADPLEVVQNSTFKLFHRYITARRKHCRAPGCNLYRVTAELNGRIDTVPTTLCPDGKHQCPEKGGFGHFGVFPIRLVIRSVSEVIASPVTGISN